MSKAVGQLQTTAHYYYYYYYSSILESVFQSWTMHALPNPLF